MAIQVKLVATVAKGPSFCVLFHGLDTSRRNASQSSAEACQMQLIGPEGASVKRQYSMPAPLGWRVCTVLIVVLLGNQVPVVCKQILQTTSCRRRKRSIYCKLLRGLAASHLALLVPVIYQKLKVCITVAQCLLGVVLGCTALDFRRCRMQSAEDTDSTSTVSIQKS